MADKVKLVSQRELAKRLRLSVQQVANLVTKGMPRVGTPEKPQYDSDACWRWYVEFKVQDASRGERTANEALARTRKLEADAMLTELAVEERRGSLVTVDYMAQQLERIAQRLRARLLAVPGKWAPSLVGIRTIPEAQMRLDEAIGECLKAMTETGEDPELDKDDGDDNPGTRRNPVPGHARPGKGEVAGKTRRPAAHGARAPAAPDRKRMG